MEKRKTEKTPNSFFKKLRINSLNDIFELYLHYQINNNLVNAIINECVSFLHREHKISLDFLENHFSIYFEASADQSLIFVKGNNLISTLWIIGVYPDSPESLIDQTVYTDGDFKYEFSTENQNFIVNQINTNDRKHSDHSRDRKVSKGT